MSVRRVLRPVYTYRKSIILVLTPCIYLPIIFLSSSKESRCAYGLAIMATYWISEAIPIAVTALLPVVLFPLLGVLPAGEVCSNYIKDTSMFSFGCLSFAIAIEQWNLHKRLALGTLLVMGTDTVWLMLGFMLPTWFISMWVNNTSATAMTIPIVEAVLKQLRDIPEAPSTQAPQMELKVVPNADVQDGDDIVELNPKSVGIRQPSARSDQIRLTNHIAKQDQEFKRLCKGMSLCVAYAANIGGTASLTGTSTNLITQGQIDRLFQENGLESGLNFSSWMAFALPGAFLTLLLAWLWLSLVYIGPRKLFQRRQKNREKRQTIKNILSEQYKQLGSISFAELALIGHFLVLIALWLSRKPPAGNGWDSLFLPKYVGDSAAAIVVCVFMFVFPGRRPRLFSSAESKEEPCALLSWQQVQSKYPWGVLLLLGGGFALADVCEKSGLSALLGERLAGLGTGLAAWQLNLVLTIILAVATEVTSNAATAALLVPVLGQLAITLSINPLYLMLPAGIATSFAFMLPVATPPNAVVFAYGHLKVTDMMSAGIVLNIIALAVLNLAINTWGTAFFHWDVFPAGLSRNVSTLLILPNSSMSLVNSTSSSMM